ncbi:hypothetical protein HYY27_02100, partial [bacterium]|nr:hypothetical protein [bacterium]
QIQNTPGGYGGETSSRGWGKATFTYNSPSARGPVWGDWRVNVIYSLEERGAFFLPSNIGQEIKYGPIQTNVDMAVEKDLKLRGGNRVTLFVIVTNLLNNQEPGTISLPDWYNMGLVAPRPDDATYLQRGGDPNYLTRFRGNPRLVDFGFRVSF